MRDRWNQKVMQMGGRLTKETSRGGIQKGTKVVGAQVRTIHGALHGGDHGQMIAIIRGGMRIGHGMTKARSARAWVPGDPMLTGHGRNLVWENLEETITVEG